MNNKKPNILFIMADQQRSDTFSHVNSTIKTPHLDSLIKESVFFKNAYCSAPCCVPSRAAIVTGKYPSECECPTFLTSLPKHEKTFMSRLKEVGYYTASIGKQHFKGSDIEKGYNYEAVIDGQSAFFPRQKIKPYFDYLKQNNINIETLASRDLISGGCWKQEEKYHLDYFVGEIGKEWITNKANEKENDSPWFFTLSFPGPHHPYNCEGTKYSEQYDLDSLTKSETNYSDLDNKPEHYKKMDMYSDIYIKNFTEEQFLKTKRSYYANISLIDEKIGELVTVLKDNDMYDNTMIIYTADHGDFMGDFGLVEKLQCLANGLMHVPLFIKPPIKDFVGIDIDDYVSNIDIAATCLHIANHPDAEMLSNYPYHCYWDKNADMKVRDHIYMEAGEIKGVIKDGIKTVHYMNRDYGEMYDLNRDPIEKYNVWDDPNYTEKKLEGYRLMVNNMYRAIPKSNIEWNKGTPKI